MGKKVQAKKIKKLIRALTLPSRPALMLEVRKVMNQFAPDPNVVARVISRDMALSAAVLYAANSTLPGWKQRVSSIRQAVVLLGLDEVKKLVSALFLQTALVGKTSLEQQLRRQSVTTARAAAFIASQVGRVGRQFINGYLPHVAPDEAYMVALFHSCGILMLIQIFPDYPDVYAAAMEDGEERLADLELDHYGFNHCQIGFLLMEKWNFPKFYARVLRCHHKSGHFSSKGRPVSERHEMSLQGVLALARWLAGEATDEEWRANRPVLMELFGLDASVLNQWMESFGKSSDYGVGDGS